MISIINQYNKVWDMLDNTEAPGLLAHHVCFGGELCDSLGLLDGGVGEIGGVSVQPKQQRFWCMVHGTMVVQSQYQHHCVVLVVPDCSPGKSEVGGKCESVGLLEGGVQRKTKTTKSQI